VAQYLLLQVAAAVVRIDERGGVDRRIVGAVGRQGDGVDRQVATGQVLLERDVGRGVDDESAVAGGALALSARQCVFLVRPGVQKHWEVAANR